MKKQDDDPRARIGELFDVLADGKNEVPVKVYSSPNDFEEGELPLWVCPDYNGKTHFLDDVLGKCSICDRDIYSRPNPPAPGAVKVCLGCSIKGIAAAKAGGIDTQLGITSKTIQEVAEYVNLDRWRTKGEG